MGKKVFNSKQNLFCKIKCKSESLAIYFCVILTFLASILFSFVVELHSSGSGSDANEQTLHLIG
jgi:hypothetical protein